MAKRNVLMLSRASYIPGEGGYKRELFLFDLMRKEGYNVSFVTSDFNHYAKQVRDIDKFYNEYPEYKNIKFVHVCKFRRLPSETANRAIISGQIKT